MWQIITLKHQQKSSQSGFITLEILVSIFIALAFVSVAMQTMVLAMMIKVQAQEKQRANQLIQEDMEDLQQQIASLAQNNAMCSAANYVDGYADALWDDFTNNAINTSYAAVPTATLLNTSGTQLGLDRTVVTAGSTAPHSIFKIKYEVKEYDNSVTPAVWGTDVIAERYVEVIPDVALECP